MAKKDTGIDVLGADLSRYWRQQVSAQLVCIYCDTATEKLNMPNLYQWKLYSLNFWYIWQSWYSVIKIYSAHAKGLK